MMRDQYPNPSALVLDYGNVLCRPQRADKVSAMAARLNVSVGRFLEAYWASRELYDTGLAPAEYWRRVLCALERESSWSDALFASLIEDDNESWTDQREEVWRLAGRFRARGGRLAFLSNNVPPLMARLRTERRIDEIFDVVVASCELGVIKPDDRIFLHCLRALDVKPEEALFVDDHVPNIDAAARLGIRTFLFQGDAATTELASLIG
jgi:putative hydrolase of the HAD superfamily